MSSSPTVFEQQREELVREIAVVSFRHPLLDSILYSIKANNNEKRAWNKSSETWTAWIGIWRVLLLYVPPPLHLRIGLMKTGREWIRLCRGAVVTVWAFHGSSGCPGGWWEWTRGTRWASTSPGPGSWSGDQAGGRGRGGIYDYEMIIDWRWLTCDELGGYVCLYLHCSIDTNNFVLSFHPIYHNIGPVLWLTPINTSSHACK